MGILFLLRSDIGGEAVAIVFIVMLELVLWVDMSGSRIIDTAVDAGGAGAGAIALENGEYVD